MADLSQMGFLTVEEYLQLPRDRGTWLLKPLIPTSGACLIYGESKLGKSYLAIQLALALTGQIPDFLGFPVSQPGKVLYLQLDTPRNVWAYRFEELIAKNSLNPKNPNFRLADRENLEHYPFDILQPGHVQYLQTLVQHHHAGAVIIDTLREASSGDEDSSTTARNVISNLVAATMPAALIIISHSRKPNPDGDKDLLADHRGSSYIVGRMDAIVRLTKTRMFYTGRSIEQGDIKIEREDNGLWMPKPDEVGPAIEKVMNDVTLPTLRAKSKILAPILGCTEEAAMSRLRRIQAGEKVPLKAGNIHEIVERL